MTKSIDTLVEQQLLAHKQAQQRQEAERIAQQKKNDEEKITDLRALIEQELDATFRTELPPQYRIISWYGDRIPEAILTYLGIDWHIAMSRMGNTTKVPEQWNWVVKGHYEGYDHPTGTDNGTAPQKHLQASLIDLFVKRRPRYELYQTHEESLAQGQRRRQQEEEQHQQALAEAIRQADILSTNLRIEMDREVQRVLKERWMFPFNGITLYHLTYSKGTLHDEDGATSLDEGSGWTTIDTLDTYGYITLQPCKIYSYRIEPARTIKLDMSVHAPIWQRFHFQRIEDMPNILKEEIFAELPHIRERRDLDGVTRLCHEDESERVHREKVGEQPLQWIRDLADNQKG